MHELKIRLDEDTLNKLKEFSEKHNMTISDIVRDAIKSYIEHTEPQVEQLPTLKMIITKYKSKCSKCGKDIGIGEIAYWAKGITVCLDCIINTMGDKTLASKYLKKREMEKVIKGLQKIANELEERIAERQAQLKALEIEQKKAEVYDMLNDYLKHFNDKKLEEIYEKLKEIEEKAEEAKIALTLKIKKSKKKE